jgi:hypothetical protein
MTDSKSFEIILSILFWRPSGRAADRGGKAERTATLVLAII